jgi:hypothetical protein
MKTIITAELLHRVFKQIEAAAIAGERCPLAGEIDGGSTATTRLAREGRIFIEVFPHNWRVATMLVGPHKGKKTAPPRDPAWKPYLAVDKETLRLNRDSGSVQWSKSARIEEATRSQPSAPRTLTRDELERGR